MEKEILNRLVEVLPRDLLLDLTDMAASRALAAHEAIRDRFSYLTGKSARALEGQARFRALEQGFQMVCEQHRGVLLEGGLMEGSALRIFQPFMRFGGSDRGIVLGLASMPAREELPAKNMSRRAGVALNYKLTPRLSLDEHDPKPGDIFVLFLVARDSARAGQIEEIAIGIINSEYESFLFYESIEMFMARYAPADKPVQKGDKVATEQPLVKLKGKRTAFKPPESQDSGEDIESQDT